MRWCERAGRGRIRVGPGVCAIGEATVREVVQNSLVGPRLAAQEDEVLERVRPTCVVHDLGRDGRLKRDDGRRVGSMNEAQSSLLRAPLLDGDGGRRDSEGPD